MLIGGRQNIDKKHSSGGGSVADYVQDSALLFFDGIENVGIGQHSNTTSIWKDLSSSNTQAVKSSNCNAVWTGDSLSFKQQGAYIIDSSNVVWNASYKTIEIVFRQPQYINLAPRLICHYYKDWVSSKWQRMEVCLPMASSSSGLDYVSYETGVSMPQLKMSLPRAITVALIISTAQAGLTCRFQGKSYNFNTDRYPRMLAPTIYLGNVSDLNRAFLGEICAVRYHSRKLTDSEIDYNATLDKVRFNLQ